MAVILLALVALVGWWWWSRSTELFLVAVRSGRVVAVRGQIPAGLLGDIKEIVRTPPVAHARILARKEADAARLVVSGAIDDGRAQRLRNTFRLYPLSRLRQAPPLDKPTFWQTVTLVSWVSWLLDRLR